MTIENPSNQPEKSHQESELEQSAKEIARRFWSDPYLKEEKDTLKEQLANLSAEDQKTIEECDKQLGDIETLKGKHTGNAAVLEKLEEARMKVMEIRNRVLEP